MTDPCFYYMYILGTQRLCNDIGIQEFFYFILFFLIF
jgi:hypothetical protein